jgi:hypothetical protein
LNACKCSASVSASVPSMSNSNAFLDLSGIQESPRAHIRPNSVARQ